MTNLDLDGRVWNACRAHYLAFQGAPRLWQLLHTEEGVGQMREGSSIGSQNALRSPVGGKKELVV